MAAPLDIYLNITDGKLMRFYGGGNNADYQEFKFPTVSDYDSFTVRVCAVRRTSGGIRPVFAQISGSSLTIAAGARGSAPAVLTTSFTQDGDFLSGTVNFATAGFQALVAANTQAYIVFKLDDREVASQPLTAVKALVTSGATLPTPAEDFYNKTEQDQRYVKRDGGNGETIILRSTSGTWGRELGVDDNGNPVDRIIQL